MNNPPSPNVLCETLRVLSNRPISYDLDVDAKPHPTEMAAFLLEAGYMEMNTTKDEFFIHITYVITDKGREALESFNMMMKL